MLRVVKRVGQQPPTLLKHLGEFLVAANGDLGREADLLRLAGAEPPAGNAALAGVVAEKERTGVAARPLQLRGPHAAGHTRRHRTLAITHPPIVTRTYLYQP